MLLPGGGKRERIRALSMALISPPLPPPPLAPPSPSSSSPLDHEHLEAWYALIGYTLPSSTRINRDGVGGGRYRKDRGQVGGINRTALATVARIQSGDDHQPRPLACVFFSCFLTLPMIDGGLRLVRGSGEFFFFNFFFKSSGGSIHVSTLFPGRV